MNEYDSTDMLDMALEAVADRGSPLEAALEAEDRKYHTKMTQLLLSHREHCARATTADCWIVTTADVVSDAIAEGLELSRLTGLYQEAKRRMASMWSTNRQRIIDSFLPPSV